MKATKRPTWTHLVSEALKSADDFMSIHQIASATGGTNNQVSAALYHLQNCRVVDCVNSNGGLYWFYSDTSGTKDLRWRCLEERVPEDKPRRNRSGNYRGMVRGERK